MKNRTYSKPCMGVFSIVFVLLFGTYSWLEARTYWIEFTDKPAGVYTATQPSPYLSQRAIERRMRLGIPITDEDVPVHKGYVQHIQGLGFTIMHQLKWLNGVIAVSPDSTADIAHLLQLSFVKKVRWVDRPKASLYRHYDKFAEERALCPHMPALPDPIHNGQDKYAYGAAMLNIAMVNGIPLHNRGFDGTGIHIAVLDGGFLGVDTCSLFDSLRINKQLLGVRNFFDTAGVYRLDAHGRMTLSCMAGYKQGVYVGTAPKACYWLLRTEVSYADTALDREIPLEEYLWAAAAEFADSAGVDVISSSLGYTQFATNDPANDNHTWKELDGNTAPVTRAADMAAKKGIIVVNSAGNARATPWKYIGFPADGDSVFSIGAIDSLGTLAPFSSGGPTADGRIKPNIVARGRYVPVLGDSGKIVYRSGTSFSCPITAGMMACFRQALPNVPVMDLIKRVQKSATYADSANVNMGFGVPNFQKALDSVNTSIPVHVRPEKMSSPPAIISKVCDRSLSFRYKRPDTGELLLAILDLSGRTLLEKTVALSTHRDYYTVYGLDNLSPGAYIVTVRASSKGTGTYGEKIHILHR